eukprot:3683713-Pyramimonas_sp.AAC.1
MTRSTIPLLNAPSAWYLLPRPVRHQDPALPLAQATRANLQDRAAHWAGSWPPDLPLMDPNIDSEK